MQSIHGVYTGKEIRALETIHVRPNVHVIITFLDDIAPVPEYALQDGNVIRRPEPTPTQQFLEKCGGWSDDRTPEEIIAEIYDTRTSSDRGAQLFQEETA